MPEFPRIYWDACVPLSYINRVEDRLPDLDWYLERSGKDFQLVTSAISVVEVAFALQEKETGVLDQAVEDAISGLWAADSPIKLVEYYPLIGEDARALIRAALPVGWRLKPNDAIHLATARRIGAVEFHTYDTGLSKYEATLGFPIRQPAATTPMLPFPSGAPGSEVAVASPNPEPTTTEPHVPAPARVPRPDEPAADPVQGPPRQDSN